MSHQPNNPSHAQPSHTPGTVKPSKPTPNNPKHHDKHMDKNQGFKKDFDHMSNTSVKNPKHQ